MPFGVWQQFLLLIQIALGIGLSLYLLHLGRTTMDSTNASISGESVEVDAFGFDISEHEIVELEHDDFCETSDVGVGLHYREKWI